MSYHCFWKKKKIILSFTKGHKVNGKNIGIYKNEDGKIYKINPYCSHLKCLLTFNSLDKTWDCPCHGSRFDIYGNVINSPASKKIEYTT